VTAQQIAFAIDRDTLPVFAPTEAKGVVYTQQWVVDFILDLVGYTPDHDLARKRAVEPAAGDGAFVLSMLQRLIESANAFHRELDELQDSLRAFEVEPTAAERVRQSVVGLLGSYGRRDSASV